MHPDDQRCARRARGKVQIQPQRHLTHADKLHIGDDPRGIGALPTASETQADQEDEQKWDETFHRLSC